MKAGVRGRGVGLTRGPRLEKARIPVLKYSRIWQKQHHLNTTNEFGVRMMMTTSAKGTVFKMTFAALVCVAMGVPTTFKVGVSTRIFTTQKNCYFGQNAFSPLKRSECFIVGLHSKCMGQRTSRMVWVGYFYGENFRLTTNGKRQGRVSLSIAMKRDVDRPWCRGILLRYEIFVDLTF